MTTTSKKTLTHKDLSQNQIAPFQAADEWLIDLLTYLRHHASALQIDFAAAVRISEYHFEEESCTDV